MKNTYIFPTMLMVLMCLAGIVCAASGDYRKAIYWVCVAVANAMVTF